MDMNKYKRDYDYKSEEGSNNNLKWLVILCAVVIAVCAFFFS